MFVSTNVFSMDAEPTGGMRGSIKQAASPLTTCSQVSSSPRSSDTSPGGGSSLHDPEDTSVLRHVPGLPETFFACTAAIIVVWIAVSVIVGVTLWPEENADCSMIPAVVAAKHLPPIEATTSPSGLLDDAQFTLYCTFVVWTAVVSSGLGSELLIGEHILDRISGHESATALWHMAQLLFGLFVSISLMSATPTALVFAVLGLWKLGFPETIAYFRSAFLALQGQRRRGLVRTLVAFTPHYMNGLATVLHHLGSSWIIVSCTTGLFPARDRAMLGVCLPVLCQHLTSLIRYRSVVAYALLNGALEIVFEWEVVTNGVQNSTMARGYHRSARGVLLIMLTAHWLYWLAGIVDLVAQRIFSHHTKMADDGEEDVVFGSGLTASHFRSIERSSSPANWQLSPHPCPDARTSSPLGVYAARTSSPASWAANIRQMSQRPPRPLPNSFRSQRIPTPYETEAMTHSQSASALHARTPGPPHDNIRGALEA